LAFVGNPHGFFLAAAARAQAMPAMLGPDYREVKSPF
jgi:hypothetical protein